MLLCLPGRIQHPGELSEDKLHWYKFSWCTRILWRVSRDQLWLGALAKKSWGKVDKYLSPDSGNNVDGGGGRPLVSESDESQLNGLMFVHCEKSNKREPPSRDEEMPGLRCWVTCVTLGSGVCWPSAVSSYKTKRFVGNTCDAAVFNIRTKEFLISSLNFLSNNVVWSRDQVLVTKSVYPDKNSRVS